MVLFLNEELLYGLLQKCDLIEIFVNVVEIIEKVVEIIVIVVEIIQKVVDKIKNSPIKCIAR
ncbi:hypothetical protein [Bacillus sp. ISL-55]|uniref:hypothetical protein n=1 Tax=Bacillus sp. ISL-55 TaxID=2819134 RepID=UPI001BE5108B|nr:hypothetical protein [Bacillus sp. ISL-55]MBT2694868.1 hypothetical protein [Bacillus sp. ISL-55]